MEYERLQDGLATIGLIALVALLLNALSERSTEWSFLAFVSAVIYLWWVSRTVHPRRDFVILAAASLALLAVSWHLWLPLLLGAE